MMKRIMVFDSEIGGHHLEYIHHVYEEALKHEENEFFFLLYPKNLI